MAFQLTPSYDFTVNEVPTHSKLRQMAAGMSITGILEENLSVTLIHLKHTYDSNVSLPVNGWLWVDGVNALWVQTSKGKVRIYSGNGGWETIRYRMSPGDSAFAMPYSVGRKRFALRTLTAGDSNESNIWWRASDNGRVMAVNVDTGVSGTPVRTVVRGACLFRCVATAVRFPFYVTRGGVSQDDMIETIWPATSPLGVGLGRKIGFAVRLASLTGTGDHHVGWSFGGEMMQH